VKKKIRVLPICFLVITILLTACSVEDDGSGASAGKNDTSIPAQVQSGSTVIPDETAASSKNDEAPETEESTEMNMQMKIGDTYVQVNWEDNESVEALKDLCKDEPLVIQMSMYGGFEQVGSIGTRIPRNDVQTTTQAGDIVLYSGNNIVVFYGSNSWAYTRLGRITDLTDTELRNLLSNGDVTITISMEE
jgi:hypothetical protein